MTTTEPVYDRDGITLYEGDSRIVLPTFPDNHFDAVVTDPPAGIGFMGKAWDDFDSGRPKRKRRSSENLNSYGLSDGGKRVPVPSIGGHSVNATCRKCGRRERTWKTGPPSCSCDQPDFDQGRAAFTARDAFIGFLSGVLAECLRVSKPGARLLCWAIPRTSHWTGTAIEDAGWTIEDRITHHFGTGFPKAKSKLKPATEDWWVARKPGGKVPELNVDACRIGGNIEEMRGRSGVAENPNRVLGAGIRNPTDEVWEPNALGRWPANVAFQHHESCSCVGTKRVKGITGGTGNHDGSVYGTRTNQGAPVRDYADDSGLETVPAWTCHPDCPVRLLDEQAGERGGGYGIAGGNIEHAAFGGGMKNRGNAFGYGDSGGASRFFFCSKASPEDRGTHNTHPTVKSTDLMRWLCRLVTPVDGLILDPFAGSASTLLAAYHEHFRAIGIEREAEYIEISKRRLAAASLPLFAEAAR